MISKEKEIVWIFEFGLERRDGLCFSREAPEELLDVIIKWAEDNDCQIGGGYRNPEDDER